MPSYKEGERGREPQPEELSVGKYGASENGAMRDSINAKISTNLVPYELLVAAALGLNYGAAKYDARNFEKGFNYTQLLESLKRHIAAIECGEDIDKDSGLPHWALIASSTAMLCHNVLQGVIIDDRPVTKQGKSIEELSKIGKRLENNAAAMRELRKKKSFLANAGDSAC